MYIAGFTGKYDASDYDEGLRVAYGGATVHNFEAMFKKHVGRDRPLQGSYGVAGGGGSGAEERGTPHIYPEPYGQVLELCTNDVAMRLINSICERKSDHMLHQQHIDHLVYPNELQNAQCYWFPTGGPAFALAIHWFHTCNLCNC